MSPRRSSRARSSQQPLPTPNHSNSNSSTNSKPDRDTRSNNRNNSPRQSSTQRSESMDRAESTSRTDQIAPRRSRRNGEEKEPVPMPRRDEDANDGEGAEEEVTRCICEQAEYPGPSATLRQQVPQGETLTDDIGNFFIQCDSCGVWQHGGCMGLLDESMLPDEYYCELCKPQFHKITKNVNGTKSSRYQPVPENSSSRSSPLSSTTGLSGKKESKQQQSESTRRRATMNSRGAYDEAEALRRAIEESKETGTLGKRGRDDSEEQKQNIKRQRTGSNASSAASQNSDSPDPANAEKDTKVANGRTSHTSRRVTAARSNKDKESREKQNEQRAAQRAEAASKRHARSERRRGEDSPPPSPSVSPSKAAQAIAKIKADTPPASRANTNRRTGRPAAKRGRLGRNQYTRDVANGDDGTPSRDVTHDANGHGGSPNGTNVVNGESGRSSKAKTHPARTSMNEMKRRVAAILEFVGRMQTERGAQSRNESGSNSSKGTNTPNGSKPNLPTAGLVRAVEAGLKAKDEDTAVRMMPERDFSTMGSQDMMETLTSELVQWQGAYGIYSR